MHRLGYTRYVAQGGDVGALVTDLMGRQAVEGLVGYHLNLLTAVLGIGDQLPKELNRTRSGRGGRDVQGRRLRLLPRDGNAAADDRLRPAGFTSVALAARMLDHDTDSYYKISRAFVDGEPVGNLTRDNIVDNITLYWLTAPQRRRPGRTGGRTSAGSQRLRAASLRRRSPCRSASPLSPARSGLPRAAGSRRPTPTSPTSTRSTRAATSPPGRSRSCSRRSSGGVQLGAMTGSQLELVR